jgi:predicted MFS family arabinose efflux permease
VTILTVLVWGASFNAIPVLLGSASLRVAPKNRDAASAVYVVAFQIGIGSGAFLGERMVSAGQLASLPLVTAVVSVITAVLVVVFRGAFPSRISPEEHHRAEQEALA